jgi:hypothetical protein
MRVIAAGTGNPLLQVFGIRRIGDVVPGLWKRAIQEPTVRLVDSAVVSSSLELDAWSLTALFVRLPPGCHDGPRPTYCQPAPSFGPRRK